MELIRNYKAIYSVINIMGSFPVLGFVWRTVSAEQSCSGGTILVLQVLLTVRHVRSVAPNQLKHLRQITKFSKMYGILVTDEMRFSDFFYFCNQCRFCFLKLAYCCVNCTFRLSYMVDVVDFDVIYHLLFRYFFI